MINKKNIIIATFLLSLPTLSFAKTFNKNNIISDYDLTNYNSMSLQEIQNFLDKKGYLGQMTFENFFGEKSTTAELIYKYAHQFQINPQYLIVTLQKEQSLIEKPLEKITQRDLDWATGFGVCDNCSKDDPAIQIYKGFDNQVYHAARRNRDYIEKSSIFNIQVGKTSIIDGEKITPENQATANLYIYTPHIHGNENFFNIWTNYFSKQLPNETLVKLKDQPGVWLIKGTNRYPFLTYSALTSRYSPDNIITISSSELSRYTISSPIEYDNYSLLRNNISGEYYLLDDNILRPIESESIIKKLNINKVTLISEEKINLFNIGEKITEETKYPTGAVLKNTETSEYWFVKNNTKHYISTLELLKIKYKDAKIIDTTTKELSKYKTSGDDTLPNNTIVTINTGEIFLITDSMRQKISKEELIDMGYNLDNIIKISDDTLIIHPIVF